MNLIEMTPEQLEALPVDTVVCSEHGYTFAEDDILRECVADAYADDWVSMTEGERRFLMVDWVSPPPRDLFQSKK